MQKIFVEIGVADFNTLVPLLHNGWRGVFVEPVPRYANKLRNEVRDLDAVVIEAAISDHNGHTPFLVAKPCGTWVDGISHVASATHMGTSLLKLPGNEQFVESTIEVPCMTLDSLLDSLAIDHVDFMKIDVEGHEMNILKEYSWRVKPTSMKIEHKHIDDAWMKHLLLKQGYYVQVETDDIYAWS